MKITKQQLRRIIKEEVQRLAEARRDPESDPWGGPSYDEEWQEKQIKKAQARGLPDDDYHGEGGEVDRGFIDGYWQRPAANNATVDYDIGYERGGIQRASDEERGLDRDPEDILYPS